MNQMSWFAMALPVGATRSKSYEPGDAVNDKGMLIKQFDEAPRFVGGVLRSTAPHGMFVTYDEI